MKKLLIILGLVMAVTPVIGQTVNFRIDTDAVVAGASIIKPDTPGATVLSATADAADLAALSFTTGDGATFISELQALATNPIFDDAWVEVPAATGPIGGSNDWNLQRAGMTIGNQPVLLITTAPLGDLVVGDYVGLVSASTPVPSLGAITVSFSSATPWDNFILGSSGSVSLLQIVPEPAHYAALLGVLGLAFVMWRRRR